MGKQKIYDINVNSKKYIKLSKVVNNLFKSLFVPLVIISILMLVMAFVGDQILNINVIFLIYIYLLVCVYILIVQIVRYIKFIRIGNSCIIKNNKEILILYGNMSKTLLDSVDNGVMLGGIVAQSHSNVVKTIGIGISTISSLRKNDISENETSEINEIPNMIIENVINDPKTSYDYYKDVKFIKKNKNYLYFNGNKNKDDGTIKNKNFKIDRKIYKNIDNILN